MNLLEPWGSVTELKVRKEGEKKLVLNRTVRGEITFVAPRKNSSAKAAAFHTRLAVFRSPVEICFDIRVVWEQGLDLFAF